MGGWIKWKKGMRERGKERYMARKKRKAAEEKQRLLHGYKED